MNKTRSKGIAQLILPVTTLSKMTDYRKEVFVHVKLNNGRQRSLV